MNCKNCGCDIGSPERIGRRDTCPSCGSDLHSCRNCSFFEPGAYNDCREPNAERVIDKERSNFCEYFAPAPGTARARGTRAGSVLDDLERLFGGKGRKGKK